jgi:hypothetical protein
LIFILLKIYHLPPLTRYNIFSLFSFWLHIAMMYYFRCVFVHKLFLFCISNLHKNHERSLRKEKKTATVCSVESVLNKYYWRNGLMNKKVNLTSRNMHISIAINLFVHLVNTFFYAINQNISEQWLLKYCDVWVFPQKGQGTRC